VITSIPFIFNSIKKKFRKWFYRVTACYPPCLRTDCQ
jgi:hypothetical protein